MYQGGFRSGESYRAAMTPYIETLSRAYPGAAMALVGHEFHGGRSAVAWNQQAFPENVTGGAAHVTAATVHIYTVVKTVGINPANVAYRGPELLSSAWQFPSAQHGERRRTHPSRPCLSKRAATQWAALLPVYDFRHDPKA